MTDLPKPLHQTSPGYYEFIAAQRSPVGRPVNAGAVLAQPVHLRQQRRPPDFAPDGQSELLHRSARRGDRLHSQPRPGIYGSGKTRQRQKCWKRSTRPLRWLWRRFRKQKPADWMAPYSAELEPEAAERFMIFLRCAGHAYHHVGQIIFLSKELTKQTKPGSASVPATSEEK